MNDTILIEIENIYKSCYGKNCKLIFLIVSFFIWSIYLIASIMSERKVSSAVEKSIIIKLFKNENAKPNQMCKKNVCTILNWQLITLSSAKCCTQAVQK